LIKLLADMIAAGRIERLPARTPWPLHAALVQLYDDAGRRGVRNLLGLDLVFVPSPEVGREALGADAAMRDLVRTGLLRETGTGLAARLEVDVIEGAEARRRLMRLEPRAVALLQRAGERWAALASTCWKYPDNARMSPASLVTSGTA
jgi:hypothetical protein